MNEPIGTFEAMQGIGVAIFAVAVLIVWNRWRVGLLASNELHRRLERLLRERI